MIDNRPVSLFRNGRNQAVRIPRDFELEGTTAMIRKVGDSLVITPFRKHRLMDMLARWQSLNEAFPDLEDSPPQEREPL